MSDRRVTLVLAGVEYKPAANDRCLTQLLVMVEYRDVPYDDLSPSGIATGVAAGQPVLAAELATRGIAGAAALGQPQAEAESGTIELAAQGLQGAEAVGQPSAGLEASVSTVGIVTQEVLGTAAAIAELLAAGIALEAALGQPSAGLEASLAPAAVGSGEAFGEAVAGALQPGGIASGLAFGAAFLPWEPSYDNPGGMGDRRHDGLGGVSGGWNLPYDGAPPESLWDGHGDHGELYATEAHPAAGHWIYWGFQQPYSYGGQWMWWPPVRITQIRFRQSTADWHGWFKVQGTDDWQWPCGANYADLSEPFQLGGATVQTIDAGLSGNLRAFRYYRLLGLSGTMSPAPRWYEFEFKIGTAWPADNLTRAGQVTADEGMGTPLLECPLGPAGLATAEGLGAALLEQPLWAAGLGATETLGVGSVEENFYLEALGLTSGAALGRPWLADRKRRKLRACLAVARLLAVVTAEKVAAEVDVRTITARPSAD